MQDFGLKTRYRADEEFALTIRMLAALAFVSPIVVINSFDTLAGYGQDLNDMLDYTCRLDIMHQEDAQRSTLRLGTCFIVQIMKYREPIMRLKDGIAVSYRILQLTIHQFGNSSIL